MMDEALLLLLILGWAAVLLPGAVRARRSSEPHHTVGGFEQAMAVLRNRPDGREILVPQRADRIVGIRPAHEGRHARPSAEMRTADLLDRRRRVFTRLLGATAASLVLAVLFRGTMVTVFLLSASVLAGYTALLRHFKVERDQARRVVHTIDLTPYEDHGRGEYDVAYDEYRDERRPLAVGAEHRGVGDPGLGQSPVDRYAGVPVATRPDDPWQPHSGVRIRRWVD